MRILVTGGLGFIGRNLTEQLIHEGHEVTVTSTGTEQEIPGISKILYHGLDGINWKEVENQEVIFHLMANNDTLCMDRAEMLSVNFYGPMKLIKTAARSGCKKFIYASSTAIYGNALAPYSEDTTPSPLNCYAESKLMFDDFAKAFAQKMVVVGLRYCNVFGPGEEHKGRRMSMIGQLIHKMMKGECPQLFEFGEQRRDWAYVKDIVKANILAMRSDQSGIYNIGSGESITFNDIVKTINYCLYTNLQPIYVPCPFADRYQVHTECQIEKARRILAFSPSYDIRSGIRDYVTSLTS